MFPKKSPFEYSIRPGPAAYGVFCLIYIPSLFLWMVTYINHPTSEPWMPLLSFWLLLSCALLWLRSYKIVLREHDFVYRSLFIKRKVFPYRNLNSLAITLGFGVFEKARRTTVSKMNVYEYLKPQPHSLNIDLFSHNDLTLLLQTILDRNRRVELNPCGLYFARGEYDLLRNFGVGGTIQTALLLLWCVLLRSLMISVIG